MNAQCDRQQALAQKAAESMANRETPLIRNAWYVAATADSVGRELLGRWILERNVVLYRREDGKPVALQNRCCHRSFPLSESTLDGDTIVCGYHGARFDCTGTCVEVPSQQHPPRNVAIKSYPVVERGPLIWIWMGAPEKADPALIPHQEWLDHPNWRVTIGYMRITGSYVHLHENLLDLSHLSFLHQNTFGTPEYAKAPYEVQLDGADIQIWRHVECELPPIYAKPLKWEGARAMRSSGSRYVSPALHVNTGKFTNLELSEAQTTSTPMVQVAQLITPESKDVIHYHFALCRNFATEDDEMDSFMLKQVKAAFDEDAFALEKLEEMQARDTDPDFYEISFGSDKASVAMRRHLKNLALEESQTGGRK